MFFPLEKKVTTQKATSLTEQKKESPTREKNRKSNRNQNPNNMLLFFFCFEQNKEKKYKHNMQKRTKHARLTEQRNKAQHT